MPPAAADETFGKREQELLGLLIRGVDNAHIAAELGSVEQTVRNHRVAVWRWSRSLRPEASPGSTHTGIRIRKRSGHLSPSGQYGCDNAHDEQRFTILLGVFWE